MRKKLKKLLRSTAKSQKIAVERDNLQRTAEALSRLRERLTVHMIDVNRITPAAGESDARAADDGLARSIMKVGLLEPLTVRRVTGENSALGGIFTLLSGSRRLNALKKLGFSKVPCFIYDVPASGARFCRLSSLFHTKEPDVFLLSDLLRAQTPPLEPAEAAKALGVDSSLLEGIEKCAEMSEEERDLCRTLSFPRRLILRLAAVPDPAERRKLTAECGACLKFLYDALDPEDRKRKRGVLIDVLPVYNTVDRLSAQVRSAGYATSVKKEEKDDSFVITLTIAKKSVRVLASGKKAV